MPRVQPYRLKVGGRAKVLSDGNGEIYAGARE